MTDALFYFDGSGLGGGVPLASWQALGAWADGLPAGAYQCVLHLWEQGWEDNLPVLAGQLRHGLAANPPADADARDAAAELLDVIDGRAEGDGAVAVTADVPEGAAP
jgi:hypothetical protein